MRMVQIFITENVVFRGKQYYHGQLEILDAETASALVRQGVARYDSTIDKMNAEGGN